MQIPVPPTHGGSGSSAGGCSTLIRVDSRRSGHRSPPPFPPLPALELRCLPHSPTAPIPAALRTLAGSRPKGAREKPGEGGGPGPSGLLPAIRPPSSACLAASSMWLADRVATLLVPSNPLSSPGAGCSSWPAPFFSRQPAGGSHARPRLLDRRRAVPPHGRRPVRHPRLRPTGRHPRPAARPRRPRRSLVLRHQPAPRPRHAAYRLGAAQRDPRPVWPAIEAAEAALERAHERIEEMLGTARQPQTDRDAYLAALYAFELAIADQSPPTSPRRARSLPPPSSHPLTATPPAATPTDRPSAHRPLSPRREKLREGRIQTGRRPTWAGNAPTAATAGPSTT